MHVVQPFRLLPFRRPSIDYQTGMMRVVQLVSPAPVPIAVHRLSDGDDARRADALCQIYFSSATLHFPFLVTRSVPR